MNFIVNLNKLKILIFISFVAFWLSISTKYDDLIIIKKLNSLELIDLINFFRHSLIYFFCTIIFLLNFFLVYKRKIFFLENIFIFFFLLYLLAQIPGLIITENNFKNISFIISSLGILLTINLINLYFSHNEKIIFIIFNFIIIFLIFSLSFFPTFIEFIKGNVNLYGGFNTQSTVFFNKEAPRSSGTSRSALLLTIYLIIFFYHFNFLKKKKLLRTSLIIFFLSVIFMFQSRTNIFLLFVITIYLFFFENNLNIKNIFKFFTIYWLLPIIISISLFFIHSLNAKAFEGIYFKDKINLFKTYTYKPIRKIEKENLSSGRFEDWESLSKKIKDKKLIGFGSQGDRFLINQSASNGLLYSLASSGMVGTLFFILFSIWIFFRASKIILFKNIGKYSYMYCFNSLIIFIILMRSILESSYAVFGIDQIVLLTSLIYLNKPCFKNDI